MTEFVSKYNTETNRKGHLRWTLGLHTHTHLCTHFTHAHTTTHREGFHPFLARIIHSRVIRLERLLLWPHTVETLTSSLSAHYWFERKFLKQSVLNNFSRNDIKECVHLKLSLTRLIISTHSCVRVESVNFWIQSL
jgi:hypothetical protein